MSKLGKEISEREICRNLREEVILMNLDRVRLMTENIELKEEIKHHYKTETFKVFEALFM